MKIGVYDVWEFSRKKVSDVGQLKQKEKNLKCPKNIQAINDRR